jgi:predicted nucleic acid-binding protein
MTLVDTSVWIHHLREGNPALRDLLVRGEAACHPLIIGELACGHLKRRTEILALLHALPSGERADDDEVLHFIEKHRLFGCGLGLIDVHLLASCALGQDRLWTLDGRLRKAAGRLGLETDIGK